MLGKRLINSNDAGSACTTNTNDYPITNLAYYKMSSAADEKGTYNGTATNVNFNVQGKFGDAGEFNGSSSYISLPAGVRQNNNFTASLWFNTNTISAAINLIAFRNGKKFQVQLNGAVGNGGIRVNAGNNTTVDSASGIVTVNNWNHLTVVQSSTTGLTVYLNNSIISSNSGATGDLVSVTGIDSIGSYEGTLNFMDGEIDQVRIFSSALNASQVTQLYNEIQCVPTIVPSDNFNTVLYTGGSQQTISLSFEPDLIWIKSRGGNYSHLLFDSVRGIDLPNDYYLQSNTTAAQVTSTNRFTLNGNSITIPVGSNVINSSAGSPYVMWNWKAGGAAVSNTDGTNITSQVSVNTAAGFSIVKYSGTNSVTDTVGHGLSETPEMVIVKNISASKSWAVRHAALASTQNIYLNATNGATTLTTTSAGGVGVINSTTFGFAAGGTSASNVNISGNDFIAYAFHSVDGYSKIGSYVGTGAVGNTIVTGFRPAFVMLKNTTNAASWAMFDNKRGVTGGADAYLAANLSNTEANVGARIEFNSTGFQLTTANANYNAASNTYIFMAFAEEVFVPDNFFNDDSTVATYKLNGDAEDDSGNGYDGTASNVTYAAGKFDEAAVFSGSSSYIDTNVNFTAFSGGDYTVSMWVNKSTDTNAFFAGTINNNGALNGIYFAWILSTHASTPNAIRFIERNTTTTATTVISTTSYTFGQWLHVVGVRSGGTNFLYVNGTPQGSASNQNITHSTDFTIGRSGAYTGNPLNGSIDQVRIFDRALDSGEVTALYNE